MTASRRLCRRPCRRLVLPLLLPLPALTHPLPACGAEHAQGTVGTLLSLVEAHGFVPNGLRRYYLNRSQPPLLSQVGGVGEGGCWDGLNVGGPWHCPCPVAAVTQSELKRSL